MKSRSTHLPVKCPSCGDGLRVQSLSCRNCSTTVTGTYDLPVLLLLERDEIAFVHSFIKNSGSLKEMAKEMGLSYPTVRNYLNDLIEKLNELENKSTGKKE